MSRKDPSQLTFVDAAALTAVLDRSSPDHLFLGELWRFELDCGTTLVTTDASALKVSLDLQARHGLGGVEKLFHLVVPALRVQPSTRADVEVAVASLHSARDAQRDLVQQLEDVVRSRLRVTQTLAAR